MPDTLQCNEIKLYFTTTRKTIRNALAAAGIGPRLDALVAQLPGL